MNSFSSRLKELRNKRGLTQSQLAKLIGVGKSTISMYEIGERTPDFETEEAIADFFNVDLNYLRGWDEKENPTLLTEREVDEELNALFNSLSEKKKGSLLAYLRFLLSDEDK